MIQQLSLLTPPIVEPFARPVEPRQPPAPPIITPGALVVPKAREGHTKPLFVGQVCEVVSIGQSLGRERVFCVPVKWVGKGGPAFGCSEEDLMFLASAEEN